MECKINTFYLIKVNLMKKIIIFILCITALFSACEEDTTSASYVLDSVVNRDIVPYTKRYVYGAHEYSDMYLSDERSESLYGCVIYGLCNDFAVAISKKDLIAEVHVFMAKDADKKKRLIEIFNERIEVLCSKELYIYDANEAENIDAQIFESGLCVVLIAGVDSDKAKKDLQEILTNLE